VIGGDEEDEEDYDYEPYPQATEAFRGQAVKRAPTPTPPQRPAAPPLPSVRPVPKPSAGYSSNSGNRPTGGRPTESGNRPNSERN